MDRPGLDAFQTGFAFLALHVKNAGITFLRRKLNERPLYS